MSVAMIPNPTATKQVRSNKCDTIKLHYTVLNKYCTSLQVGDEWEIDKSHFQIQEEIGSGNYGSVHRGYLTLSAKSEAVVNYQELMMHEGKSTVLVAAKTIKGLIGYCKLHILKLFITNVVFSALFKL